ncbi:UNVERIFIED_CONTAM: hypothetical protein PYX00_009796 [Menopon gallinae]|uniref:Uncharacterized protein n=1 Tax=Menopon gallinae TaxID=328185 RepID=A0AAW2HDA9_9NEOP
MLLMETKEPETVPEPEAVTNCQVEETNDVVPTSEVTEVKEVTEVASPETPNEPVVEEQTPQVTAVEEQTPQVTAVEEQTPRMTVVEEQKPQVTVVVSDAKVVVMGAGIPTVKGVDIIKPVQKELTKEELPPPLPASPPPTEPKEELVAKDRESEQVADEAMTPVKEALTTEKCAPEVQKTVELTESVRNAVEEAASCDQSNEDVGATDTSSSEETIEVKAEVSAVVLEQSSHSETVANVVTLSSNAEETSEKEEFGAGESLAEMDSATETVIAASNEVIVAE